MHSLIFIERIIYNIDVHILNVNDFIFLSTVAPLLITDPTDILEVIINGDFILNCQAEGFPRPSITWIMNNTMISNGVTNDDASMTVISSTLMVSNANFDDSGMYYCQATSIEFPGLLVNSTVAMITVVGKFINGH